MNSKFNLIFVCFLINLINVCIVSTVNTKLLDSLAYYNESSISKLSPRDRFNLHHAFVVEDNKWKNGRIGYQIDENFNDDEKRKIFLAMTEIEVSSCIRFVRHDPSHNFSDYVMIMKDYTDRSSSSSDLGCLHLEKQFLWLGVDMLYDVDIHDTILHELLHTIGFDHHHQRSDRDTYIAIHLENTNLSDADILADYAKHIKFNPWLKYVTPFDFDSVMLYEAYSDSVNDKAVITSKINGKKVPVYREQGLSKNDKILLNRFYECDGTDSRHPRMISYKDMHNYRMSSLIKEEWGL
ncbi:astacin-like metalloprotease toxin 5 [Bradysia coprophila]|uniref:astacin-like metalloprotease toxin 5 n=1 Tax=Bradysia coprophila TaxID=38358 RepID=UPI00187DB084|nr:astacin-like metalloprotease toxin 5 [Bradysia coprophila]